MDVTRAQAFLREHHHAVLGTLRRDGRPQLSPVTVGVDAEGYAVISTREPAYKVRNLRRDPRASLCVFPDGFYGEWVQVEGEAHILSLPDAMEPLVDYYRDVSGEHPDWADYRAAMERDRRCLIRIRMDRVGPSVSG
ncbi:PPOX class F420-dependent oxidoreductase [Actinopolymorpha sp. NPDC004070]|uniref:PPOX class F420-dependent oxidoreductase n=1 Tax=Actinopolymorpha sp. NPDC004070 TaxID=3154548 RepID=UPI0033B523C8